MTLIKNILASFLIVGIFALHPSLNKGNTPITYLQYYVYGNTLNLSTNNSIDKNLLEIKWVCEAKNTNCKDLVIYKNGKQINDIPSERGNQKLIVIYNQHQIGEVSQDKTSAKQANQYNIELLSQNNSLFFKAEIIGPSPYNGRSTTVASL